MSRKRRTAARGLVEVRLDQNGPGYLRASSTSDRTAANVTPAEFFVGAAPSSTSRLKTGSLVYWASPLPRAKGRNARARSRGRQPNSVVSRVTPMAPQPQASALCTKLATSSFDVLQ